MDLRGLLQRRRMVRSFDGTVVDEAWLDDRCADALWSPTAGNSAGVRLYPLGPSYLDAYFDVATDEAWRRTSTRLAGLRRAGAFVLVTSRPQDYASRYGESDKADATLEQIEGWPLPYWHTDAAMATMALLLLVEEGGYAAALWGSFRNDEAVCRWAGIENEELFATVFIGHADGADLRSRSLRRVVPTRRERVRRLRP